MFSLQRSPLAALHSAQLLPTLIPSPPTPPTEPGPFSPMESAQLFSPDNMAYEKLLMAAGFEQILNQQPDFEKLALQLLTMHNTQPTMNTHLTDLFSALTPTSTTSIPSTVISPVTSLNHTHISNNSTQANMAVVAAAAAQMNAQISASIAALHDQMNSQLLKSVTPSSMTTTITSPTKNPRKRPHPLQITQSNFQPKEYTEALLNSNKNQASPLDLSVKSASSTTSSTSRFSLDLLLNQGRISPNATVLSSPIDLSTPSNQIPQSPGNFKPSMCKKKKLMASLITSANATNTTNSSTISNNASIQTTMVSTVSTPTVHQPPSKKFQAFAADSSALATALTSTFASPAPSSTSSTSGSAASSQSPSPALPVAAAFQISLEEALAKKNSSEVNVTKKVNESRPNKRKLDSSLDNVNPQNNKNDISKPEKRPRAKASRTNNRKHVTIPFELLPGAQLSGAVLVNAERVFTCEQCGEAFAFADRLQKHCKSKHGQPANSDRSGQTSPDGSSPGSPGTKSFHCNVCSRSFARSDMLTRHSRLHSGQKPYTCEVCSQVFSRSDHLATHRRTHSGEKPYKCCVCSYSACRRDMITRHMRTHFGRRAAAALLDLPL